MRINEVLPLRGLGQVTLSEKQTFPQPPMTWVSDIRGAVGICLHQLERLGLIVESLPGEMLEGHRSLWSPRGLPLTTSYHCDQGYCRPARQRTQQERRLWGREGRGHPHLLSQAGRGQGRRVKEDCCSQYSQNLHSLLHFCHTTLSELR